MAQLDVDRIGELGRAAWKRLKKNKTWDDWMAVGEALLCGRHVAMQAAETNRPEGKAYNQYFSQYLTRYGLAEIDKSARAKLLFVMENRGAIEDFRNALPLNIRQEVHHPVTMLRRWQAATRVSKPKKAKVQDESESQAAYIQELEAARDMPKPLTLSGAREAYLFHLRQLPAEERMAELKQLGLEVFGASEPKMAEASKTGYRTLSVTSKPHTKQRTWG
jgi:hypothetical protein